MTPNPTLINEMTRLFKKKGGATLTKARKDILLNCKDESSISQALQHFSKVTLRKALPVFPALISMSCEAVGGDPKKTVPFGKVIVMITGAADLHDDVIDQSFFKGPKQTVFGKFGQDITILAGDLLLVQGLTQLNKASEALSRTQRNIIRELVEEAVFEISTAEVLERQLMERGFNLTPKEYDEVIRRRAVVPELIMKMGAIVGSGKTESIEILGQFGRTFGIITAIADEFTDIMDHEEMKNRRKAGCLPLPVVYALQNAEIKALLLPSLNTDLSDEAAYELVVNATLESSEIRLLQTTLATLVEEQLNSLKSLNKMKILEELEILLRGPLKYIETILRV